MTAGWEHEGGMDDWQTADLSGPFEERLDTLLARHWRCGGENTSLIALMASTASTSAVVIRVAAGAGAAADWPGSASPGWAARRRPDSASAAASLARASTRDAAAHPGASSDTTGPPTASSLTRDA